jgi:hypothetical protein
VYISDASQALRDFGWRPQVRVDEGLERLWSWAQLLEDARTDSREETRDAARVAGLRLAGPGLAPVRPSA